MEKLVVDLLICKNSEFEDNRALFYTITEKTRWFAEFIKYLPDDIKNSTELKNIPLREGTIESPSWYDWDRVNDTLIYNIKAIKDFLNDASHQEILDKTYPTTDKDVGPGSRVQ